MIFMGTPGLFVSDCVKYKLATNSWGFTGTNGTGTPSNTQNNTKQAANDIHDLHNKTDYSPRRSHGQSMAGQGSSAQFSSSLLISGLLISGFLSQISVLLLVPLKPCSDRSGTCMLTLVTRHIYSKSPPPPPPECNDVSTSGGS